MKPVTPTVRAEDPESLTPDQVQEVDDDDQEELECGCFPPDLCFGSPLIYNEGSTARDYLARERNWLSWIKLAVTLFVISAALLLRFQFGSGAAVTIPEFEIDASVPLGILFFVAATATLVVGLAGFFRSSTDMQRQVGFVSSGWISNTVIWGVGALTCSACVVLLVADNSK